ncbi:MAG TPA: hypothetical protein VMY42_21525 [Thermoguttaceae bacterium]|nr:hypothetical protein [Thermoguttaceae bacterium]
MLANNARMCDQVRIDSVYDPLGDTDLTALMIDMKDYDGCMVLVIPTITTTSASHLITGFKVVSNTTSIGGGTDHDICEAVTTDGGTTKTLTAANMGTSAPSALHNQLLCLDVRADQMYPGDRYICAVMTSTGTYGSAVVYIRYNGHCSFKDMFQTTRTAFQYDGNL